MEFRLKSVHIKQGLANAVYLTSEIEMFLVWSWSGLVRVKYKAAVEIECCVYT